MIARIVGPLGPRAAERLFLTRFAEIGGSDGQG